MNQQTVLSHAIPALPAHLLERPHLLPRLAEADTHPLTVVAAPAGFGKTTLVSWWMRLRPRRVAWVTLEQGDCGHPRLLRTIATACQAAAGCGGAVLARLQTPFPPPPAALCAALVEEASAAAPFWLVLDDYHLISDQDLHRAVESLVEHLPPSVRLVLITRADPPLPLARLRARGLLCELCAADLRFGPAEGLAFLRQVVRLDLDQDAAAALVERSEGWAVGLHLAALAIQRSENPCAAAAGFGVAQRYLIDYLVEEVLQHLPPALQRFLTATALLDRLCGELCDALLEDLDSDPQTGVSCPRPQAAQLVLEQIERANLFLVPLDAERRWFRYHQLFAAVLRQRLRAWPETRVRGLHRRAAAWLERASASDPALLDAAVGHALAAQDWGCLGRLLDHASGALMSQGELATLLRWTSQVPAPARRASAEISLAHALALAMGGRAAEAVQALDDAERIWRAAGATARLADVFHMRAQIARSQFDNSAALAYAEQALALQPDGASPGQRSSLLMIVASAQYAVGDLGPAEQTLQQAGHLALAAPGATLATMIDSYQSLVLAARGRLHEAARASERLVERCGNLPIWPVIGAHTQLGALAYEWNDLAKAEGHLSLALALGRQSGQEGLLAQTYLALARLRQGQGACPEALALCEQAVRAADLLGNRPMALRAGTVRAALALAQGDRAEAQRWRAARSLPPDGSASFYHEQSYLLLARLLQAEGEHWRALALLQQIERLALAQGRLPGRLAALTLQARGHSAAGDQETALGCLGRALALGRPEGFARCFLDEGAPVRDLLLRLRNTRHARRPADPQLRTDAARLLGSASAPRPHTDPERPSPALVEALTPREREVLRLLAEGAPNQEIARRLVLAPATVKKHIANILGKLEARNRTQAVARARALNLL